MKNPKAAIDWAIELADSLPERYRELAFSELLRHALNTVSEDNVESNFGEVSPKQKETPSVLSSALKDIPDAHLVAAKGDRDQQVAWAVAELFNRGDEINNQAIREIIKTRLAISPPNEPNTSRSLQKLTPKYVMREKGESGKAYSYLPTINLIEIFDDLKDSE